MRATATYLLSLVFAGAAAIALARVPSLPIAAGQSDDPNDVTERSFRQPTAKK